MVVSCVDTVCSDAATVFSAVFKLAIVESSNEIFPLPPVPPELPDPPVLEFAFATNVASDCENVIVVTDPDVVSVLTLQTKSAAGFI